MHKPTEQQAAQIVELYRAGKTGFEIALAVEHNLSRVYETLRAKLSRAELAEVRRSRGNSNKRTRALRLASRWIDAAPLLRRGARVRSMTLDRRIAFSEEITRFLVVDKIVTDERAFLDVALDYGQVRANAFVVTLPDGERLLTREDLDDMHYFALEAADAELQNPEDVRIACVVERGPEFAALEEEIALLAMAD